MRDPFEPGLVDDLRASLRAETAAAWGQMDRRRVIDLATRRHSERDARRRRSMILLAAAMVVVPVGALAIVGASRDREAFVVVSPRPASSEPSASTARLDEPRPRGAFTKVGDLLVPRQGHMAVLLRDGRVMVMGGLTEKGGLPPRDLQFADRALRVSHADDERIRSRPDRSQRVWVQRDVPGGRPSPGGGRNTRWTRPRCPLVRPGFRDVDSGRSDDGRARRSCRGTPARRARPDRGWARR